MPLFKKSLAEKFTPTKIKLTDFYQSSNKGVKINDNVLSKAKTVLRSSGYTDSQIAKLVTANKPILISQAKDIIEKLNRGKVYGFERDPQRALKTFLNKERVKFQTIAGIRKEHIIEAAEENLSKVGTTSLNQRAIGPNSNKFEEGSVLSRRNNNSAIRSFGGKNLTKTASLTSRPSTTTISRPGIGSGGSISRGITIKPKF